MKKYGFLLAGSILASALSYARPGIIAHRGHWDVPGSAQNSIASLQMAQQLNIYGSEFDVYLTADGVAVIHHDNTAEGLLLEETPYAQLKWIKLINGEALPTLEQYLAQGKKDRRTKLILEIKPHKRKETEDKAVAAVLAQVRKAGLSAQTEYISFSLNICETLIRLQPAARVAYLRGDMAPEQLKEKGLSGLDYHYKVLEQHPEWIRAAQDLGLTVNVWTVNEEPLMQQLVAQGVDYITTDKPEILQRLLER